MSDGTENADFYYATDSSGKVSIFLEEEISKINEKDILKLDRNFDILTNELEFDTLGLDRDISINITNGSKNAILQIYKLDINKKFKFTSNGTYQIGDEIYYKAPSTILYDTNNDSTTFDEYTCTPVSGFTDIPNVHTTPILSETNTKKLIISDVNVGTSTYIVSYSTVRIVAISGTNFIENDLLTINKNNISSDSNGVICNDNVDIIQTVEDDGKYNHHAVWGVLI